MQGGTLHPRSENMGWAVLRKGEYERPQAPFSPPLIFSDVNVQRLHQCQLPDNEELIGAFFLTPEATKRIVGKLLVRGPKRRGKFMDLRDDAWICERGGGLVASMTREDWKE